LLVIDLDELLISENLRYCVTSFKKKYFYFNKTYLRKQSNFYYYFHSKDKGKRFTFTSSLFLEPFGAKSNLNAN